MANKIDELICRFKGHEFIKTVETYNYKVETCVRCGLTKKMYHKAEDHNLKKNK